MPLCGCFPQCACELNVAPPELLKISGNGDPASGGWTITAIETPLSINHQLGGLSVTPGGSYGHTPGVELDLDNAGDVQFSVSPVDGLRGDIALIPSSAGGVPTGVSLSYHGATAPAGYLLEYGQLVLIATYPDLFAAIGHVGNGGVDPGGGQFRIPDGRGLFDLGRDDMGGVAAGNVTGATTLGATGGNEDAQLGVTNLPAHTHSVSDPGHAHGVSDPGHAHAGSALSGGSHVHGPGTGGRTFITAVSAGVADYNVNRVTPVGVTRYTSTTSGGGTTAPINIGSDVIIRGTGSQQLNNDFTDIGGSVHSHSLSISGSGTGVSVVGNATGITVPTSGGSGAAQGNAFLILPPYRIVNKIIKT